MPHPKTPPAEVNITKSLIQKLLQSQHPDLADLPIKMVDAGWDNEMYRLGNDLVLRLPRRKVAVPFLLNEQKWLPQLASRLPLPIPTPIRTGQPEFNYPYPWSILWWMKGQSANFSYPDISQAEVHANFLKSLHTTAPPDAPENELRGVPLIIREPLMLPRVERLKEKTNLITPKIQQLWKSAIKEKNATESCWLHGDLHARNVLTENHKITGIIDWGDITSGDVATDLASIWNLFPDKSAREKIIELYEPDNATLVRAMGWAVFFGVILLDTGLIDNAQHAAMGRVTLERLTEDL